MVKIQFWMECLLFHCYYSQIYSDPEWYYLLGSRLGVKYSQVLYDSEW